MTAPKRIFVVGTDTAVGKTHVVANLTRHAPVPILPQKPVQSGTPGELTDAARLLEAGRIHFPTLALDEICPLTYDEPLAPGIAHNRASATSADLPADPLAAAAAHLRSTIERHRPQLVLVEGAGGLHVPMPGDTWQPAWICALADAVIIVGRAGLGTINHTLLTIDALAHLNLKVLGFILNTPEPSDSTADPSISQNAALIEAARGIPHLATTPHESHAGEATAWAQVADTVISRCKIG